ncbi:MAG: low molecular weight phosphotyrosine protein phosphatase [Oscillospiraceae bacterium]|nr:low molecular weight phosphotyrosine protein phosphatase [Oscillospiraceae bacterium]
MIRILFICHGNICRSPMAEFIFRDMVEKKGIGNEFVIASTATSTEEIWGDMGNPVYPPAAKILNDHGINCKGKRAVLLKKSDYDKYDMFIGMDSNNIRNMHRIFTKDTDGKIHKMMDFTERGGDVADPWYTRNFETTYNDIYQGCQGLLEHLMNKER